jgi:methionyl-tRNA synthetase
MNKFYITTPIYYINAEPHIGHAYTTVLADVFANYHRIMGQPTYFLTGTDEHGQKIAEAAAQHNRTPKEHCDYYSKLFKDAWKELNIRNNDFIRTTEDRHIRVVQKILQKIYQTVADDGKPLIYAADYEGWYCKYEERYWTQKDLVDGNCPDCGRPVQKLSEKNYFFRMSYYQDWLVKYINDNPDFIQPDFRRNEVLSFLKQPLGDLCISRPKSRLSWGIELPFDKDYVCYVWFDALINYISAIGYNPDTGEFDFHNQWWPANHLIAKDILTTHAVYWPCMLKAIGLEMPKTMYAHGYWISGGTKMSKSLGNIISPLDLKDVYGVDPFRFYMIREMTLGQDSSYSEESFIQRYNSELANDLGNLLSRLVKMIFSYCHGEIPRIDPKNIDPSITAQVTLLNREVEDDIEKFRINSATDKIMAFVRSINRYIEQNKPWELAKNGGTEKLNEVLFNAANLLAHAAFLLKPVIPEKGREIFKQLNFHISGNTFNGKRVLDIFPKLEPGQQIEKGENLFPRLQKPKAKQPEPSNDSKAARQFATFDDFKKLQFKVAEVVEAEKVEGADKLLKLKINIGREERQIVAGIAKYYQPEQLIGKKIIVVVNLEPARIRGIESNGMLLAASQGQDLVLLTVDQDIDSGAKIS